MLYRRRGNLLAYEALLVGVLTSLTASLKRDQHATQYKSPLKLAVRHRKYSQQHKLIFCKAQRELEGQLLAGYRCI